MPRRRRCSPSATKVTLHSTPNASGTPPSNPQQSPATGSGQPSGSGAPSSPGPQQQSGGGSPSGQNAPGDQQSLSDALQAFRQDLTPEEALRLLDALERQQQGIITFIEGSSRRQGAGQDPQY